MMYSGYRILAVDDEDVGLSMLESTLLHAGYVVDAHSDPHAAAAKFSSGRYDLVVSDFLMPGMSGRDLLGEIRRQDPDIPFVFLTANTDVAVAVDLLKAGADDHLTKPIDPKDLLFRVEKCLAEREQRLTLRQIETERELLELENRKLVNWKELYAAKDASQTEQMIQLLSRTINQSGGFMWIDLLEGSAEADGDGNALVPREVVDMTLEAARTQREIFDRVTRLGELEAMEMTLEPLPLADFVERVFALLASRRSVVAGGERRRVSFHGLDDHVDGWVQVDMHHMETVFNELLANAVKYSPEDTPIVVEAVINPTRTGFNVDLSVRNDAVRNQAVDAGGKPIIGVPYDYAERIFDMFYTIESFPTYVEGEAWRDGTGLYACRKILRKHGGWIRAGNGLDYSRGDVVPVVKVTLTLPYTEQRTTGGASVPRK